MPDQPFLRRRDQHVDAERLHVHPQRAGSDAIEHEQTADGMHRRRHAAQIVVGQQDAGRRLDVRREHEIGLVVANVRFDFFDRMGTHGALAASLVRRACSIVAAAGMPPISKICVHR